MFRRKEEDNLFSNSADPHQAPSDAVEPAAAPAHAANSGYGSNTPAPSANVSTRFSPEPRPSSFRNTAAPLPSDLSRSRLPDSKPGSASASGLAEKGSKSRRVLTVGNDILLKGEIATCDRLVIEGKVDATLNDVHTVEIAETGSFKGSAQIEDAEISGLFEGDLVVRGRLVIYGTGRVRGKISYGEVEIERGGELSGEIKCGNNAQSASAPRAGQRQPAKDAVAA